MNPPTDSQPPQTGALASARYKPLPRVLGAVQHRFMERCRRILERAFLEAEEALQEASIGAADHPGLTAIEQLRSQRSATLRNFAEALGFKFNEVLQGSPTPEAAAEIAAKLRLDVVEGEAFNAIQRIKESAVKLRRVHQVALDIANKRINHLVLQVEVSEVNSPLEPASIIDTFVRFAGARSLSKQAKEALIQHFQMQLERKLSACYAEVNQVLIDARILPEAQASAGQGKPGAAQQARPAARPDKGVPPGRPMAARPQPARGELDESTIPVLEDKVEEVPKRPGGGAPGRHKPVGKVEAAFDKIEPKSGLKQKPPVAPQRHPVTEVRTAPAAALRPAGGHNQHLQQKPRQAAPSPARQNPAQQPQTLKPDPRQRQSPPNCAVPGRTNIPGAGAGSAPGAVKKPRTASKPSAYQLEILEFYRKRAVMSAPDMNLDELRARPTTAFLGDNPERDKVMAMCTELFDELRNDAEVPLAVRQKLMSLRVTFTAYAVNRNPNFLGQAENPARCLLELLWDLGRSLQDSAILQYNIIFIQISEAVESILIPSLAHDRDFFREYRKILARHY